MMMNTSNPLVSIGLPVYNGERYIKQALDSLLAQDYENFELIISDNASTDRTPEICLEYAARDKRVQYNRNNINMGSFYNFNRVFGLSSGEYFMWASHDDYWDSRYIRSCLEAFNKSGAIVLAGAMCDLVNPEKDELMLTDEGLSTVGLSPGERFKRYKSIFRTSHVGGIFYGIYKHNALSAVLPLKNVIANDHLLLAGLCFQGEFITVPERLVAKRWGGISTSLRNIARNFGLRNPLLIYFPYFVREVLMQSIIFRTNKLTLFGKIRLASWSLGDYCRYYFLPALRRFIFWMVPPFIKSPLNRAAAIMKYRIHGRKPWTPGYGDYKEKALRHVMRDKDLLDSFRQNKMLPKRYGFRLDERIVEYPWIVSRLSVAKRSLLDAGSSLNYPYILDLPALKSRSCVIYSLSAENIIEQGNVSYVYGDLRKTVFDSESFDEIVCISTLEHVGMNSTFFYSKDPLLNELKPDDYQAVIREFRRLLKPGGKLFITVPFGRNENRNWLQQFNLQMIEQVISIFGGSDHNITYYKYLPDGWQIADATVCADSSYFDIHSGLDYEPDYVAAARSVACLELVK